MLIPCSTCSVILMQWPHNPRAHSVGSTTPTDQYFEVLCLHMCIPVHSPWLPGCINVTQTVLFILTTAGLFLDRPRRLQIVGLSLHQHVRQFYIINLILCVLYVRVYIYTCIQTSMYVYNIQVIFIILYISIYYTQDI